MIGKPFQSRANRAAEVKTDPDIRCTILSALRIGKTAVADVSGIFTSVSRIPDVLDGHVTVNAKSGQDIACTCTFAQDRLIEFSIYYKATSEELNRLGGFQGIADSIASTLGPPNRKSGETARMWQKPNLRIILALQTAGSVRFGIDASKEPSDETVGCH